ncbi:hypothetical protein Tco_0955744 [Tanacetum coccineum]|uniref:MAK10-like protein n=1 Tax=Tanacetum coccineum TaxID=301880 RepID=A0ABQ5E834_9ASTR
MNSPKINDITTYKTRNKYFVLTRPDDNINVLHSIFNGDALSAYLDYLNSIVTNRPGNISAATQFGGVTIDLWLQVQIFYDLATPATRRTIDQSDGGKLRDRNTKESWALLEDLALYDNESWNNPREFAKPVKAISLPQDVPSTYGRRLIELENQVQRLMEAHLASMQPTQVNKITSSCESCSGPHDTQYCM